MKRIIPIILILVLMLSMTSISYGADTTVIVNGNKVNAECVIVEGRVLAPVRAICEAMGATVKWDPGEKKVTAEKIVYSNVAGKPTANVHTAWMWIGKKEVNMNGYTSELDVPAQIISGNTMIPVRAIGELFEAKVEWNDKTKTATISYATNPADARADSMQQNIDLNKAMDNYINNLEEEKKNSPFAKYGYYISGHGATFAYIENITNKETIPQTLYLQITNRLTKQVEEVIPFKVPSIASGEKIEVEIEGVAEKYIKSYYIDYTILAEK